MAHANISVERWQEVREERFRVLELALKGAFAYNQDPEELLGNGRRHGHDGGKDLKEDSARAWI
jgi:hypothetical protein